ncbi:hypothetical protein MGG_17144 [Pyricularia oryzae 70-15]|uniref:Uncharacterized protein n=3 Tax=Pyricularia oryzae TaxID=318829 RepID=G4N5Y9_PYRO7|nr:uncharacterized protein MGG_17144 [Pyricularia oryzae 70-15]EHA50565.1 hypothetical protein MGG_17144 [Pyricularia oryzae 70-15]ELQ42221.1 hypothetical protein OOU_Y34scaffold00224g35 [Pyricularia oryzae Y34]
MNGWLTFAEWFSVNQPMWINKAVSAPSYLVTGNISTEGVIETSLFGLGPLAMPAQAAGECKGHRRKRQCGMMVQSKPGVASIMAY